MRNNTDVKWLVKDLLTGMETVVDLGTSEEQFAAWYFGASGTPHEDVREVLDKVLYGLQTGARAQDWEEYLALRVTKIRG